MTIITITTIIIMIILTIVIIKIKIHIKKTEGGGYSEIIVEGFS